jgi:hypothetical protein
MVLGHRSTSLAFYCSMQENKEITANLNGHAESTPPSEKSFAIGGNFDWESLPTIDVYQFSTFAEKDFLFVALTPQTQEEYDHLATLLDVPQLIAQSRKRQTGEPGNADVTTKVIPTTSGATITMTTNLIPAAKTVQGELVVVVTMLLSVELDRGCWAAFVIPCADDYEEVRTRIKTTILGYVCGIAGSHYPRSFGSLLDPVLLQLLLKMVYTASDCITEFLHDRRSHA